MTTTLKRTYPEGVPTWVDTEQQDPQAAQEFYGGLFGWTFRTTPRSRRPGSPPRVARSPPTPVTWVRLAGL
jgi:uncharacterized protein